MASNVEPEEVQAILDLTQPADGAPPAQVAPRDFERPLRLGPDDFEDVQLKLRRTLPEVAEGLAAALRCPHELELLEVAEANVEGLFSSIEAPLATLRFHVAGQPGWLIWSPVPALRAIEVVLGAAEAPEIEARELTSVERGMLVSLLSIVVTKLCSGLGVEPGGFSAPEATDDLGNWQDGGALADRRRLHVRLSFEGPGGASQLRLYLPGIEPAAPAENSAKAAPALPRHLEEVRIGVAARLGQSEIPLSDLLAIEVGDVIPLQSPVEEPLVVFMENRPGAHGVLGSKNGNLAVRVIDVEPTEQRE